MYSTTQRMSNSLRTFILMAGLTALLVLDLFATGHDPYFTSPVGLSPVHVGATSALIVAADPLPGSSK